MYIIVPTMCKLNNFKSIVKNTKYGEEHYCICLYLTGIPKLILEYVFLFLF